MISMAYINILIYRMMLLQVFSNARLGHLSTDYRGCAPHRRAHNNNRRMPYSDRA